MCGIKKIRGWEFQTANLIAIHANSDQEVLYCVRITNYE
jgi:hypothetical protein